MSQRPPHMALAIALSEAASARVALRCAALFATNLALAVALLVLLLGGCSRERKVTVGTGPDASVVASALPPPKPPCEITATYIGNHSCVTGGGPEDGSECETFTIGRFGARTIIEPIPKELRALVPSDDRVRFAVADASAPSA